MEGTLRILKTLCEDSCTPEQPCVQDLKTAYLYLVSKTVSGPKCSKKRKSIFLQFPGHKFMRTWFTFWNDWATGFLQLDSVVPGYCIGSLPRSSGHFFYAYLPKDPHTRQSNFLKCHFSINKSLRSSIRYTTTKPWKIALLINQHTLKKNQYLFDFNFFS